MRRNISWLLPTLLALLVLQSNSSAESVEKDYTNTHRIEAGLSIASDWNDNDDLNLLFLSFRSPTMPLNTDRRDCGSNGRELPACDERFAGDLSGAVLFDLDDESDSRFFLRGSLYFPVFFDRGNEGQHATKQGIYNIEDPHTSTLGLSLELDHNGRAADSGDEDSLLLTGFYRFNCTFALRPLCGYHTTKENALDLDAEVGFSRVERMNSGNDYNLLYLEGGTTLNFPIKKSYLREAHLRFRYENVLNDTGIDNTYEYGNDNTTIEAGFDILTLRRNESAWGVRLSLGHRFNEGEDDNTYIGLTALWSILPSVPDYYSRTNSNGIWTPYNW